MIRGLKESVYSKKPSKYLVGGSVDLSVMTFDKTKDFLASTDGLSNVNSSIGEEIAFCMCDPNKHYTKMCRVVGQLMAGQLMACAKRKIVWYASDSFDSIYFIVKTPEERAIYECAYHAGSHTMIGCTKYSLTTGKYGNGYDNELSQIIGEFI